MNTEEVNPHLTAKIVVSYVRHHRLEPDQLSDLITSIRQAMGQLAQPAEPVEVLAPAVSVRRSVHRDYVVCLDCGYRGKTLRRHIETRHGLGRAEYLLRWGLRSNHPLTAPAYSEHCSTAAKARGFSRKSMTEIAPVTTPTASTPVNATENSKSRRARRSHPASKPNVAGEAAAAPISARRRQSRARVDSPSA